MVGKFWGEVCPVLGGDGAQTGKLIQTFLHFLPEFFIRLGTSSKADNRVIGGESAFMLQAEDGGDEFAGGEVSAGTKDDHDEWGEDPIRFWGRAGGVLFERRDE